MVQKFRDKHPDESQYYIFINPVKIEVFNEFYMIKNGSVCGVANGLLDNFKDNDKVIAYAKRVLEVERASLGLWKRDMTELAKLQDDGGVICEFKWNKKRNLSNDIEVQYGFLVLKDGDIIKRNPL